jgi:hypothetical protein
MYTMHLGAHAALFVVTRAPPQLSHATFLVGADALPTDLLMAAADVPLSAACVSATLQHALTASPKPQWPCPSQAFLLHRLE